MKFTTTDITDLNTIIKIFVKLADNIGVGIRTHLSWLIVPTKDIPSFSVEHRACSIDIGIIFESECYIFVHTSIEINDERIQFVV